MTREQKQIVRRERGGRSLTTIPLEEVTWSNVTTLPAGRVKLPADDYFTDSAA